MLGQGRKDMFHETSPKPGEENDAERDKAIVITTDGISPRTWAVIGQSEKLACVRSRFWYEQVSEEDESDEIER